MIGEIDVNDNRWYHVAGAYDGTTMRHYIDGNMDVSRDASGKIKGTPFRVLIGENDYLFCPFLSYDGLPVIFGKWR